MTRVSSVRAALQQHQQHLPEAPAPRPNTTSLVTRLHAETYQGEVVDDVLLLQHLQPQELDFLLVPRQAEVVQGRVSLQRRLCRQLFFLQPEREGAPQGRSAHGAC